MAALNQNRVINIPNNKSVLNEPSLINNKCDRLKTKVLFMVYHQNIRSLRGKFDELLSIWPNACPHVLCFSEHHLHNQEINVLCCSPYKLATKYCRSSSKFGGVCIYVHESVSFTTIDLDMFCKEHEIEVCAVKLCLISVTYCIISIYRSPTGKIPYFVSALDSVLNKLHSTAANLILCGDLNINYLSSSNGKTHLDLLLTTYGLYN
jgi:exonuclease III